MDKYIKQILTNQREMMDFLLWKQNPEGLIHCRNYTDVLLTPKQQDEECSDGLPKNPLDLCSNCKHSRFHHTEKNKSIPCSFGGKGCGCKEFVDSSGGEK